ncbi:MAG: hypothetical protein KDD50_08320 [Bdellovibrionales bacterium]|nr:hypothetical protein [Bdellovibrionales bacterium]
MKAIILGNSGSGKSWLGRKLSNIVRCNLIEMDKVFWEPGGFNKKRDSGILREEILKSTSSDSWVCEGVFGRIADLATPNANTIVLLDLSWDDCKKNLINRGPNYEDCQSESQAEQAFIELIDWAKDYSIRENHTSRKYHHDIYSVFEGEKILLKNREEVHDFVKKIENSI